MEDERYMVWNTWTNMKEYVEQEYNYVRKADGIYIYNEKRKIIDGMSSMFNCSLGYGNQEIVQAITQQLNILSAGSVYMTTLEPSVILSKKLLTMTNNFYEHVFYTNSGSEACESAIKMSLQYYWNDNSKRNKILSLDGCYHGNTLGALNTCSFSSDVEPFLLSENYIHVKTLQNKMLYEDKYYINSKLEFMENVINEEGPEKIAALIFEPVQLSNNVNIFPPDYLKGLLRLKQKYGFLLIADEIATGFGRCGMMFAMEEVGFFADILLLGKGITSGYLPLGAVMVTSKIFNNFLNIDSRGKNRLFRNGFTTSGNPAACACANAVVQYMLEKNVVKNVKEMGEFLLSKLKELEDKYDFIHMVRGKGLLIAVLFNDKIDNKLLPMEMSYVVRNFAWRNGLVLYPNNDSGQAVLIAPPLIINREECHKIVKILDRVFTKCTKLINNSLRIN